MSEHVPAPTPLPAPRVITPQAQQGAQGEPSLLPLSDDLPVWVSVALGVSLYLIGSAR
jgi:hypothetical protein